MCVICGNNATERHHVFGGANRKLSERYDLVIWVCAECHRGTHGIHGKYGKARAERVKRWGQEKFEIENPGESFLKIFGRNYL